MTRLEELCKELQRKDFEAQMIALEITREREAELAKPKPSD